MFEVLEQRSITRRAALGLAAVGGAAIVGLGAAVGGSFGRQLVRESFRGVRPAPRHPLPARWPGRGLETAWIGHSTVLLKIDGFTILTDPVFSEKVGVRLGGVTVGLKRMVAPALTIEDLPRIDLVLLSHAHMDHLDLPSLEALENRRTEVVTAKNTSDLVRADRWAKVRELAWNEEAQAGPARLKAVQVNHFGHRATESIQRGYNGYLIECGRYRVLFGGDTAWTESFRSLKETRTIDLAVLPIGGYNPWHRVHCTPEEAWKMANEAGADRLLAIHHGTFQVSKEPPDEPARRLLDIAGRAADRVVARAIGSEYSFV